MRGTYNDDKLRNVIHQSDNYGTIYRLEEGKGILREQANVSIPDVGIPDVGKTNGNISGCNQSG
jgi:hypothetical protein